MDTPAALATSWMVRWPDSPRLGPEPGEAGAVLVPAIHPPSPEPQVVNDGALARGTHVATAPSQFAPPALLAQTLTSRWKRVVTLWSPKWSLPSRPTAAASNPADFILTLVPPTVMAYESKGR